MTIDHGLITYSYILNYPILKQAHF